MNSAHHLHTQLLAVGQILGEQSDGALPWLAVECKPPAGGNWVEIAQFTEQIGVFAEKGGELVEFADAGLVMLGPNVHGLSADDGQPGQGDKHLMKRACVVLPGHGRGNAGFGA